MRDTFEMWLLGLQDRLVAFQANTLMFLWRKTINSPQGSFKQYCWGNAYEGWLAGIQH